MKTSLEIIVVVVVARACGVTPGVTTPLSKKVRPSSLGGVSSDAPTVLTRIPVSSFSLNLLHLLTALLALLFRLFDIEYRQCAKFLFHLV